MTSLHMYVAALTSFAACMTLSARKYALARMPDKNPRAIDFRWLFVNFAEVDEFSWNTEDSTPLRKDVNFNHSSRTRFSSPTEYSSSNELTRFFDILALSGRINVNPFPSRENVNGFGVSASKMRRA